MLVDALQYLWANASYNRPKKQLCAVLMIFLIQTMIAACRSDPIVRPPSCVAPKDWFPKTPPPTNAQPDPNSDCDFYKWAWQSFLSVTQGDSPGNAKPRFLEFQVPFELFVSRVGKRVEKTTKVDLPVNPDSVIQAGSQGLLVDQNGRAIYYQTHLNSVFVRFVRDGGYTESTKLRSAPASLEFPKGSLELKSSWKIVAPGEDASKFFTTAAIIPLLGLRNGQVFIDPAKTREETVALLGLHVVGVVQGHPEFIWATFEHNDNAPDLPPDLDPRGQEPVNSQRNWILYPKGTRARDCNKKPGESPLSPLKFADEDRQVLQPKVAVFRQFPFGGDDEPDLIKGLNDSVHRQLPADLTVWRNYSLMGAVWLNTPDRDFIENADFTTIDASDPGMKVLGGDKKLSNTTMETFTQSTQNCFSCHNTMARPMSQVDGFPAKKLNVSHVLTNAYAHATQSRKQVTLLRSATKLRADHLNSQNTHLLERRLP